MERDESTNHMENLEEGINWSANFAMDDEHEHEIMKEWKRQQMN
jgi:hypothetical protein